MRSQLGSIATLLAHFIENLVSQAVWIPHHNSCIARFSNVLRKFCSNLSPFWVPLQLNKQSLSILEMTLNLEQHEQPFLRLQSWTSTLDAIDVMFRHESRSHKLYKLYASARQKATKTCEGYEPGACRRWARPSTLGFGFWETEVSCAKWLNWKKSSS